MEKKKTNPEFCYGCIPICITTHNLLLIQSKLGFWEFAKGHPEKNETEIQSAMREFEEESGISS